MTATTVYPDVRGQVADVAHDLSRLAARYGRRRGGADPLGAAAALLHDVAGWAAKADDDARARELDAVARMLLVLLADLEGRAQHEQYSAPRRAAAAACALAVEVLRGSDDATVNRLVTARARVGDVQAGFDVAAHVDGPRVVPASSWLESQDPPAVTE